MACKFQSTLPTRGSDASARAWSGGFGNFNPRSPRGGATRPHCYDRAFWYKHFNPRSPRGGATIGQLGKEMAIAHFNPRSPRGGATGMIYNLSFIINISIHAPHEGERRRHCLTYQVNAPISIHAPHEGERR